MLKKYAELWDGIKYQIKTINNGKESDYRKDFMKISWLIIPLNKPLNSYAVTIIIRSIFEEDGKLYLQFF